MPCLALRSLSLLLLAGPATLVFAGSSSIGVASAHGSFTIDGATVSGNATLFEGTRIDTGTAAPVLRLENGSRLWLAPLSRGQVYSQRLVLEKGQGEMEHSPGYRIEAKTLRIQPGSPAALTQVSVHPDDRVQVVALAGPARVTTESGTLIANLEPGNGLLFDSQLAGAVAPSTVTGCLFKTDGRYQLTDETAHVPLELKGSSLDSEVGHRVEITGTNLPGSSGTVLVARIRRIPGTRPAATASAKPGAPARHAGGMSLGTKAVIAGVVVAGAGAGAAVAVSSSDEKPPISR